jgi:hypothetical protein
MQPRPTTHGIHSRVHTHYGRKNSTRKLSLSLCVCAYITKESPFCRCQINISAWRGLYCHRMKVKGKVARSRRWGRAVTFDTARKLPMGSREIRNPARSCVTQPPPPPHTRWSNERTNPPLSRFVFRNFPFSLDLRGEKEKETRISNVTLTFPTKKRR